MLKFRFLKATSKVTPLEKLKFRTNCPRCSASRLIMLPITKNCEIKWDSENSQFLVNISYRQSCHPYFYNWEEIVTIKSIPLTLAQLKIKIFLRFKVITEGLYN